VIRPDTVAGRTFYYGITAERDGEGNTRLEDEGNWERKRTATRESRTEAEGNDACLVSRDGVKVDVSLIRFLPTAMNIFRLIGQPTHPPAVQPHAHQRVCLQATSRISRRYSSCSRKFRQRAHVEVSSLRSPRGLFSWTALTTRARYFVQNAGFVCRGIRHSLPGPAVELGFLVQLHHEAVLHRQLLLHSLSHEGQVPVRPLSSRRLRKAVAKMRLLGQLMTPPLIHSKSNTSSGPA